MGRVEVWRSSAAFAPTMFIWENYMISGRDLWPTFCRDIHTVKIRLWINNSNTYIAALQLSAPPPIIKSISSSVIIFFFISNAASTPE